MKKFMLHMAKALSVCAILGVASVSAQVDHKIIVNVPFDFTVLDKHLSAGTYTLTSETPQSAILMRSEQAGTAMFILALTAQTNKVQECAKLVFHQYGDRYFLSTIWYPGTDRGRELIVSKVEQEIARNMPKPGETAVLVAGSKPLKPVR
jgi:hypothetical protein